MNGPILKIDDFLLDTLENLRICSLQLVINEYCYFRVVIFIFENLKDMYFETIVIIDYKFCLSTFENKYSRIDDF